MTTPEPTASLTDEQIMEVYEQIQHEVTIGTRVESSLLCATVRAALALVPVLADLDGMRYRWLRDSDCIHPATDRVPEHRLEIFRIKGDDFLRNGCAVADYDEDIDFCMAADKEWRDPGPASQQSDAVQPGGELGLIETHPNYVAGFKAGHAAAKKRYAAQPASSSAPAVGGAPPSNWHRHHVAVEKAALVMVRNALRNDAEAGRSVRAEMLEMLDAATSEIADPAGAAGQDAVDARRWRYAIADGGNQRMNWQDVYDDWDGDGDFTDAIDAALAAQGDGGTTE